LAVALLGVHVAAEALQIHKANHQSATLDGQIAQVFSASMPTEKMLDPRRQMQSQLDRIRRSGPGPQYFLRTLKALSGAVSDTPKTTIDALSFREQSLDMKVTAPSLAALSHISQFVGKQGLTAEIQSSTPTASGVEAHMQLRAAGSGKHR
jgi:type II secretory pathway component PulL